MYSLARSILFQLDAERAHHIVINGLAKYPSMAQLATPRFQPSDKLRQVVLGLPFDHPVGLAAGLDKNAVAVPGFFACGFASVEVGTVTPVGQPGNPQPRLFRLKADDALVNRMGFNNDGAKACANQLSKLTKRKGIIGVNIGRNKTTSNEDAIKDYERALRDVLPYADYIAINVSSPNTPGLRDLQSVAFIEQLLGSLQSVLSDQPKPIFIKLSPDLADESIHEIGTRLAESPYASRIGIIATNTTITRGDLKSPEALETGGLSGRPLTKRSTEVIRTLRRATLGTLPIIGCGGIFDADDAYAKIRAGASLLQIYTSFIYRGPQVIKEIVEGLDERLKSDNIAHIRDAIGLDA